MSVIFARSAKVRSVVELRGWLLWIEMWRGVGVLRDEFRRRAWRTVKAKKAYRSEQETART